MSSDRCPLGAAVFNQSLDAVSVQIVRKFGTELGSVTRRRCFLGKGFCIYVWLFFIYAREGRNGCDVLRYVTRYVIRYGFCLLSRAISSLSNSSRRPSGRRLLGVNALDNGKQLVAFDAGFHKEAESLGTNRHCLPRRL